MTNLLTEPWAKIDETGQSRSLIDHCLDVAVMARTLMAKPILKRRLEAAFEHELTNIHLDRLAVLAGLHDLGKALKGFQDKSVERTALSGGHVAEALAVLLTRSEPRAAVQLDLLRSWFDSPTDALYVAVCHHGRPIPEPEISRHIGITDRLVMRTIHGHDPIEEIRRLMEALLSAYPESLGEAPGLTFYPSAQHLFAGVLMTADWMASGFAFLPGERSELARRILTDTAWSDWHGGGKPSDLLEGREPRSAQTMLLELATTNRLVVLEAPTGTGKTEAALIWASRLASEQRVDGLYFAVPTRSAATELHHRIGRLMGALHPGLQGKIVRAVPGQLDTDRSRPDYPPETWAVAAPKRVFAAPIAVGTIDQALLSILRAKHAWMRNALLSRHLLVVDEIHASDPYMATLTKALIDRHLALGGYVLAMSATLGETALAQIQGRKRRSFGEAVAVPYPAIRTAESDHPLENGTSRKTSVELRSRPELAELVMSATRGGQAVLWLRSTVTDAVSDSRQFESASIPCLLHHSRYALPDRSWLDQQLTGIFGPGGKRRGIVAVTTQTAEQSLDIDADLLITDACPADVLLQRLGRLHRHRTGTEPQAFIIDPGNLDQYLTDDGRSKGREGQGWPFVYQNLLSVKETIDWVAEHGRICVPEDSRRLVELATHRDHLKEAADRMSPSWQALWRRLYRDDFLKTQLGEATLIDWQRPYRDALVLDDLATRLGIGSVTIPTPGLRSPFTGIEIEAMPVPHRWLRSSPNPPDLEVTVADTMIALGELRMTYTRLGLQRLTARESPGHK